MTKVKFSKTEENTTAFLEKRRASLERYGVHMCRRCGLMLFGLHHRYLNRIAKHPVLRKDEDFREFLENPNEVCCGVCHK